MKPNGAGVGGYRLRTAGTAWPALLTVCLALALVVLPAATAQAKARPVRAKDLLSAPIPAACTHPAGRLKNGSLPGLGPSEGFATIDITGRTTVPPAIGDVTGDGVADAVAMLHCSAGGVDWPQILLLYTSGTKLLASVDLSNLTPAEHAAPVLLRISKRAVIVEWQTHDGCCSNSRFWGATFRWQPGKLLAKGLHRATPAGGSAGAAKVAKAWFDARRRGDVRTARGYEAREYNVPAGSAVVPTKSTPPVKSFTCRGSTTNGVPQQDCLGWWVQKLAPGQYAVAQEVRLTGVGSRWLVTGSSITHAS